MILKPEIEEYIKEITEGSYKGYVLLLKEVCRKLELELFEADFDDDKLCGQIEKDNISGHFVIYVNKKHSPVRKRFTIAHEIGHYISFSKDSYSKDQLVKDGYEDYAISYRIDGVSTNAEIEANQIAAEMLMPEEKVHELAATKLTLEDMADRFYVSHAAMTIRLKDIYPDLVVL